MTHCGHSVSFILRAPPSPAAVGAVPDGSLLSHVPTTDPADKAGDPPGIRAKDPSSAMFSVGAGLPPVPKKLVNRIQAGEFVDMAELLPDRMGCTAALFHNEKVDKLLKSKRRQVSTITEWIQCFSIYAAVLTAKHPNRIQDLLGYQALIVEACSEYNNEAWLGYDRQFRQMAAASPGITWARIDPTLWNMAFTGQAKAVRCKFCFSLTHVSEECDWAPTARVATTLVTVAPPPTPTLQQWKNAGQICYSWNQSSDPHCPYPSCKYQHICLFCAKDPQAQHKNHKAIHCSRRRPQQGQQRFQQPQPSSAPSHNSSFNHRFQPYP